jgi:hypothetical protein
LLLQDPYAIEILPWVYPLPHSCNSEEVHETLQS